MANKTEVTRFGNATTAGSGNVTTVVHNVFGARASGGTSGVLQVDGMREELVFYITGDAINDAAIPLVDQYLPAGAVITTVYWDTIDVFDLTGTTPTILVGTSTSEVTNGLVISEAVAESANTAVLTGTLTGTWSVNTPIQARTKIGVALGGTLPVAARSGKGRLTINYQRPNNVVDG